jgi:hypothetical protein
MPPTLMASLRASADLTVLAASLDVPVLVIAPTNDQNAAPALMERRMASVPSLHYASVPNVGHSTADPRTAELFEMWVEHVEDDRPVNAVETTTLEARGGEVVATATITEAAPIDDARFWYLPLDDETYLGAEFWWTTPDPYFPSAVWQSVPMTRAGGGWEARLPAPASRLVAGWVDAADSVGGRAGYAAGFIEVLSLVPDAEASLCTQITADCHARTGNACRRFLERCTDGCMQAWARCLVGHALGFCDTATEAACESARTDCLDTACRADFDPCLASGFTECAGFRAGCLRPCEQALFSAALDMSATDLDYVADNCGLGAGR